MSTKICPYCHEEISEDAILCKYCHNLLTDDEEDTAPSYEPDTEPENEADEETKERTRVFSKSEAAKAAKQEPQYDDYEEDDDDDYDDEYDDDDDDDDDDYDEGSAKKTFITAAIITLGILLVVIIAIFAGYKIFGSNSNNDSKAQPLNPAVSSAADSAAEQSAAPADVSVAESKGDDTQSIAETESKPSDDTSSVAETADSSSAAAADSSSNADTQSSSNADTQSSSNADSSSNTDSSSKTDESSSSQASAETDDEVLNKSIQIVAAYNGSGVKSTEVRGKGLYTLHMNDGADVFVAVVGTDKYKIVSGGKTLRDDTQ